MYKLTDRPAYDTCLADEIRVAPADLVRAFGAPEESDGYKVSGEYTFTDPEGDVYTLYEWKSTSLYDQGLDSPETFWRGSDPVYIHVGARAGDRGVKDFVLWVQERVAHEQRLAYVRRNG